VLFDEQTSANARVKWQKVATGEVLKRYYVEWRRNDGASTLKKRPPL
jgi:hypothetical protein